MPETMRDPAIATRMRSRLLEPVPESIPATQAFIRSEIARATTLPRGANQQPE